LHTDIHSNKITPERLRGQVEEDNKWNVKERESWLEVVPAICVPGKAHK